MITKDQLKHLSKLSKIDLTENEFETYTKQIEKIIKYLDKLDEISFEENNPSLVLSFNKIVRIKGRHDYRTNYLILTKLLKT